MNNNNGAPWRGSIPEHRPVRRLSESERVEAANRAARRAQEESLPSAPRRRRNTPVDFAAMYDIPPEQYDTFDQAESGGEIMEEAGHEAADVRPEPYAPPAPPAKYRASAPQPSKSEPIDDSFLDEPDTYPAYKPAPAPQRQLPNKPIDDSFLDEPDTYPIYKPAPADDAPFNEELPDSSSGRLEELFAAGLAERAEPENAFDSGNSGAGRKSRAPARKKSRR